MNGPHVPVERCSGWWVMPSIGDGGRQVKCGDTTGWLCHACREDGANRRAQKLRHLMTAWAMGVLEGLPEADKLHLMTEIRKLQTED